LLVEIDSLQTEISRLKLDDSKKREEEFQRQLKEVEDRKKRQSVTASVLDKQLLEQQKKDAEEKKLQAVQLKAQAENRTRQMEEERKKQLEEDMRKLEEDKKKFEENRKRVMEREQAERKKREDEEKRKREDELKKQNSLRMPVKATPVIPKSTITPVSRPVPPPSQTTNNAPKPSLPTQPKPSLLQKADGPALPIQKARPNVRPRNAANPMRNQSGPELKQTTDLQPKSHTFEVKLNKTGIDLAKK